MTVLVFSVVFFLKSQRATNKMDTDKNAALRSSSTKVELEVKKHFKLLSWNIDGLDHFRETLGIRTRGVVDVIRR